MKKKRLFILLGWAVLALGMGVFLFVENTTLAIRLFSIACCLSAGILLTAGRKAN